jgi:hypothetical protein
LWEKSKRKFIFEEKKIERDENIVVENENVGHQA